MIHHFLGVRPNKNDPLWSLRLGNLGPADLPGTIRQLFSRWKFGDVTRWRSPYLQQGERKMKTKLFSFGTAIALFLAGTPVFGQQRRNL